MTKLDAQAVRKLASDHLPALAFDQLERWFPIRAESWLGHVSCAPWEDDPTEIAALPVDRHKRGTALCEAGPQLDGLKRLAGAPNDRDAPLRIARSGADAIGDPEYAKAPDENRERFLTFAGWDVKDPAKGGDLDYLYDAFSELSSAINRRQAWQPLQRPRDLGHPGERAGLPYFAHPQPPSPAVYCEVEWAGVHARRAKEQSLNDFAGIEASALDAFLQVTYHYFFPAREALRGQPQTQTIEGQWAAVSLFFRVEPASERDADKRPVNVDLDPSRLPEFAVFSLDPPRPGSVKPTSVVRPYTAPKVFPLPMTGGRRVRVWVGSGSHRLFPIPDPAEFVFEEPEDWPTLNYPPGSDFEVIVPLLVFIGLLGALVVALGLAVAVVTMAVAYGLAAAIAAGVAAAVAGAVVLAAALIVLFVAVILLYLLFKALSELWDDDASIADIPASQDTPVTPIGTEPSHPQYGDPVVPDSATATQTQPPGWSDPADPQGDTTGWWATNEGSPDGWDATYYDLAVVSRFRDVVAKDRELEPPAWWDFTGRWGIKVPFAATGAWHSGTRRTSENGTRSWSYWHAQQLLDHLHA